MAIMDFFKKKSSSNVAKGRLQMVLMSDRAGCSPEVMEQIKNEIIQVISKYINIDSEELDIKITQSNESGAEGPAIVANIPIKGMKHTL